jgi:hypothetical protein
MGKRKAARPLSERRKTGRPVSRAALDALCARLRRLPVLDTRTAEEILGYDAFGIPR